MDEKTLCYPHERYTITTLQDEGQWWARARVAAKEAGGDRPVLGEPWQSRLQAKAAAEAFWNCRKAE